MFVVVVVVVVAAIASAVAKHELFEMFPNESKMSGYRYIVQVMPSYKAISFLCRFVPFSAISLDFLKATNFLKLSMNSSFIRLKD